MTKTTVFILFFGSIFSEVGAQNGFVQPQPPTYKALSVEDLNPKSTLGNFTTPNSQTLYPQNGVNPHSNQVLKHQQEEMRRKAQLIELQKDLDEIKEQNRPRTNTVSPYSKAELEQIRVDKERIFSAYDQLKSILDSKPQTSLSDVFYIVENAWGEVYVSKSEYDTIINNSVSFIRKWMKQQKLKKDNLDNVHYAIQQFMSNDLSIKEIKKLKDGKLQTKSIDHKPFFYDNKDFKAHDDHRNFFVTKCLATGSGQCKSLPLVYLILAERLGVKAYMSTTPNHSFIRYVNAKGEIENYEPTSNWKLSNQWYIENLGVTEKAVETGLFMDTLNKQKVIADNLLDLAVIYIRKIPLNRENFLAKLLTEVDKYYPKNNNLMSYVVYKSYLEGLLRIEITTKNLNTQRDIENDPKANHIQQLMVNNELQLKDMGYVPMSDHHYEELMTIQEFKGKIQDSLQIDGKQKRNLFKTVSK